MPYAEWKAGTRTICGKMLCTVITLAFGKSWLEVCFAFFATLVLG